jgi:Ca2+:H+ antiporter
MGTPGKLTSVLDRIRSGAIAHASSRDTPTLSHPLDSAPVDSPSPAAPAAKGRKHSKDVGKTSVKSPVAAGSGSSPNTVSAAASPLNTESAGEKSPPLDEPIPTDKPPYPTRIAAGSKRFVIHTKNALLKSWINVLLIFVPIGIASHFAHLSPTIIFAMNAIAIVPLAGLLAHATETVALRLGDTLGALLNVSFGNAVELIILYVSCAMTLCLGSSN